MEVGQMKNIIVLKNLPSNIVDEAIVVLKPNLKMKQIEHADKTVKKPKEENFSSKDYIVKEAESVISSCISSLDKQKDKNIKNINKVNQKYNRLKIITIILSVILMFNFIIKVFI